MKVKELIEKLKRFDPEWEAFILIDDVHEYTLEDVDKEGGSVWVQGYDI